MQNPVKERIAKLRDEIAQISEGYRLHFVWLPDGGNPSASLLRDPADNLYGTTLYGGNLSCPSNSTPTGCGVVFKLDAAGKETVLHAFSGSDGSGPTGLVAGGGSFYGTTTAR